MKIRFMVNGSEIDPGKAIRKAAEERIEDIDKQVLSRVVRVTNALRNSALKVLGGTRSGRRYKRPGTMNSYYQASAPGEPPAVRTGNLRQNWNPYTAVESGGAGSTVLAGLESGEKYAGYLEKGTSKMAPRPYVDRIKEDAKPEIERIFSEPYT